MNKNKGHIHCPVNGWDCPYYKKNGICGMYPDADPLLECDDFGYFWMDDDSMDYFCYDDHTEKEGVINMRGIDTVEINKLNDEEIDSIINYLVQTKNDRKEKEALKLKEELNSLLSIMSAKGIYPYVFCDSCGEETDIIADNIYIRW